MERLVHHHVHHSVVVVSCLFFLLRIASAEHSGPSPLGVSSDSDKNTSMTSSRNRRSAVVFSRTTVFVDGKKKGEKATTFTGKPLSDDDDGGFYLDEQTGDAAHGQARRRCRRQDSLLDFDQHRYLPKYDGTKNFTYCNPLKRWKAFVRLRKKGGECSRGEINVVVTQNLAYMKDSRGKLKNDKRNRHFSFSATIFGIGKDAMSSDWHIVKVPVLIDERGKITFDPEEEERVPFVLNSKLSRRTPQSTGNSRTCFFEMNLQSGAHMLLRLMKGEQELRSVVIGVKKGTDCNSDDWFFAVEWFYPRSQK